MRARRIVVMKNIFNRFDRMRMKEREKERTKRGMRYSEPRRGVDTWCFANIDIPRSRRRKTLLYAFVEKICRPRRIVNAIYQMYALLRGDVFSFNVRSEKSLSRV